MNLTRFISRALLFLGRVLCMPFLVAFTGEDNSTSPQFVPQAQMPHPTLERERLDGLNLEEHSFESAVGNRTGCVLITRQFRTTIFLSNR